MINPSGLEPRGRAVLIRMYEPDRKQGAIVIPELVKERTDMVQQNAVLLAVGESCWVDDGYWKPWFFGLFRRWVIPQRAQVGDRVLVTKFAGFVAKGPLDGKLYRLVNDRDIFCAIVAENVQQMTDTREAA